MTTRVPGEPRTHYPKAWYHPIPETDEELAGMALRFTLSQPVTSAIPPGEVPLFRLAVKIAHNFRPITAQEEERLRERARGLEPLFHIAG